MKQQKHLLHLALAVWGCLTIGCLNNACRQERQGCRIEGITTYKEYPSAMLTDLRGKTLLTAPIENGRFDLVWTDSLPAPQVCLIHMQAPGDSTDRVDMPVVVEQGRVSVSLNEYINTSGTPLNRALQAFLNGLQGCRDEVREQPAISSEALHTLFSNYYRQQILLNRDNVVGEYIYNQYGSHLNSADRAQAEASLSKL
ncbi:MAG: hypothetical protein LBL97_03850 [Prevotellaceae bacterium]|jgi:hypothetical protein|nr:hypothetical protein [Prevotellaceae bacterium]